MARPSISIKLLPVSDDESLTMELPGAEQTQLWRFYSIYVEEVYNRHSCFIRDPRRWGEGCEDLSRHGI